MIQKANNNKAKVIDAFGGTATNYDEDDEGDVCILFITSVNSKRPRSPSIEPSGIRYPA